MHLSRQIENSSQNTWIDLLVDSKSALQFQVELCNIYSYDNDVHKEIPLMAEVTCVQDPLIKTPKRPWKYLSRVTSNILEKVASWTICSYVKGSQNVWYEK